jgi:beta-glucosidase
LPIVQVTLPQITWRLTAGFVSTRQKHIQLYWDFENHNATGIVHPHTDVALVFINAVAGEGADRSALRDDFSDALVRNIAAQSANTVVVMHNAGIRLVDQWIEHPNVSAVIFAHLPGQESGDALVDILWGHHSPSGKLPYTVARNESDYVTLGLLDPVADYGSDGRQFARFPQDNFNEGILIDYRAFEQHAIEPRFEFGFGLTYSQFEFSKLSISVDPAVSKPTRSTNDDIPPQGGHDALWEVVANVSARLTNVGDRFAHEVAQLYLGIPGRPTQLRGFDKVALAPGESATVVFPLRRRDLAYWDTLAQEWQLVQDRMGGQYEVYVGSSSRDLPLQGNLQLYGHDQGNQLVPNGGDYQAPNGDDEWAEL